MILKVSLNQPKPFCDLSQTNRTWFASSFEQDKKHRRHQCKSPLCSNMRTRVLLGSMPPCTQAEGETNGTVLAQVTGPMASPLHNTCDKTRGRQPWHFYAVERRVDWVKRVAAQLFLRGGCSISYQRTWRVEEPQTTENNSRIKYFTNCTVELATVLCYTWA